MSRITHSTLTLLLGGLAGAIAAPACAQAPSQTAPATPSAKPAKGGKPRGGIDLTLDFVGNLASNPVGGVEHGTEGSYWIMAQSRLDLDKLFGLHGTEVDVQAAWFAGRNLAREKIGSSISPQQTWRPVAGGRLTRLTVKHAFDNGLSVIVGRAPLNSYFNNSPLNCVFMSNAICLTPYGPITDLGVTAYPNSSWAALVRYDVGAGKRWYLQAGAFDYDNGLNLAGKNGLDFSFRDGTGTLSAAEVGYQSAAGDPGLPRTYRLGAYRNTDGGKNPYRDLDGNSAGLTGRPLADQDGDRAGWYAMADQTVWRGEGKRNLALLARYFINTGNPAAVKYFAAVGAVKTGTFVGRERDTLALFVSNTHFDPLQMAYLRDRRARYGGSGTPDNDEMIAELSYGYQVRPGVRLMPNIQYVVHPDPIYAPTRTTDIPDTLILGLRVDVQFAQLFGW